MDKQAFAMSQLDYSLPESLIAQQPAQRRDESRLLVVDRAAGAFRDASFKALPALLSPGDLLVLNNTKVLPARIAARRATGGRIDGLFLAERGAKQWDVLLTGSARLKPGERVVLQPPEFGASLELIGHEGNGRWITRLVSNTDTAAVLERIGRAPLPPYIRRNQGTDEIAAADLQRFQTVYAQRPGAVAAPTAGLHFTHDLFAALEERAIERAFVTLHVGLGTFAPVKTETLDEHRMHSEWYEMPEETAARVRACRSGRGRVVAVGTTSVRVLESCAGTDGVHADSGWTDLFIQPPHRFRAVDMLLTNLHLPRSTLLALVTAFAGPELIRAAYEHAIEKEYRFYSYGDAMLIA